MAVFLLLHSRRGRSRRRFLLFFSFSLCVPFSSLSRAHFFTYTIFSFVRSLARSFDGSFVRVFHFVSIVRSFMFYDFYIARRRTHTHCLYRERDIRTVICSVYWLRCRARSYDRRTLAMFDACTKIEHTEENKVKKIKSSL